MSRNVAATISYHKYKDHRLGTYEINKISLSCFDDKICIQNNGYDGLALGKNYLKKVFVKHIIFNFQSNQEIM